MKLALKNGAMLRGSCANRQVFMRWPNRVDDASLSSREVKALMMLAFERNLPLRKPCLYRLRSLQCECLNCAEDKVCEIEPEICRLR